MKIQYVKTDIGPIIVFLRLPGGSFRGIGISKNASDSATFDAVEYIRALGLYLAQPATTIKQ